jgi:C-terminal processing protease CtpA/Prc
VVFNVILAFAVLTAQVNNIGYAQATYEAGVRVPVVVKGGAAERYGVMPGDIILALDNEPVQAGALRTKKGKRLRSEVQCIEGTLQLLLQVR